MCFCCCQNKNDILRRFLQRLKQCIKRTYGKHMHLINDIHLILSLCRTVYYLFPDLTNVIYTIVGSCINLNYVHGSSGRNRFAHLAFPTRTSVYWVLAVYCFGKYFCHCRLTGSSCSTKKIGMSDTVGLYLIFQCCHNMILSFDIVKFSRSEFTV